ncbi:UNVERIFIED_CONTAM: ABC-2 type transport system permease protein [Acetivibrio alkalicellulosi]
MVGGKVRHIEVLKATAFATYKEWAAYRSHMAVSLFVGPVFFLVQVFIWSAVYSTQSTVVGFNLEQMILYYGIASIINYLIYDSCDWNLQMLIRTGKFITFMLRPVSHCYFALCQKLGHRLLALWLEFIPVYLLFTFVFKINMLPANAFWALVSISLSFILVFLTNYCIGITGFWLTKTEGLRRAFLVMRDLCAGTLVPLTLFPGFMQRILFFLPFQYITYVPIRVFIGTYELAGIELSIPEIVGMQALAVIVMFFVYKILWYLGVKRFTGVGA